MAQKVFASQQEIALTSEDLASASQQLASSSQEQASSIEEVSTSLEEVSGMLASSVKNAQETLSLATSVKNSTQIVSASMNELQDAVKQIAETTTQVDLIVKLIEEIGAKTKVIDEIVFQTKLLSFNASVEAERAGEYGRGFAVVAQEVGNLAQLSGRSASEINHIVKDSIAKAQDIAKLSKDRTQTGVVICERTAVKLQTIDQASNAIQMAAEEVLKSSEEQSIGIKQINESATLISKATQENAASAEKCALGSQNLLSQGKSLEEVNHQLQNIVYGGNVTNITNETVRKVQNTDLTVTDKMGKKITNINILSNEDSWERL